MKFSIKKFNNCFGIKKIEYGLNSPLFQNNIYSSNGLFKTSFARTFKYINEGKIEQVVDRISGEKGKIELINENGDVIPLEELKDKIIIFSRELDEENKRKEEKERKTDDYIARLAISKEKKEKYNQIVKKVNLLQEKLESACNSIKISETDLLSILGIKKTNTIQIMKDINSLFDNYIDVDISNIEFNKITKKAYCGIDSEEFKQGLTSFVDLIGKCSNTSFDNQFNMLNYKELLSTLKKLNYMNKGKGRGIIYSRKEYYDFDSFKGVIENEIEQMKNNEDVVKKSNTLISQIGDSQDARNMQSLITTSLDYIEAVQTGRKNLLLNYLYKNGYDYVEFRKTIDNITDEYDKLVQEIRTEPNEFSNAIKIFSQRFHPVFSIEIQNIENLLNDTSLPSIVFKHNSHQDISLEEAKLKEVLSSGEKTALRIIGFIEEYLTKRDQDNIIILDDVIETFDYANRFAFIEYIKEMVEQGDTVINLTHNFDFFRTIKYKIHQISNNSVSRGMKENNKIRIYDPSHIDIESVVNADNIMNVIASIPFVRESEIILNNDTKLLTNCLHYKEDTKNIKIIDIISNFGNIKKCNFGDSLYFDSLIEEAKKLSEVYIDNYDIKKKTVLSIASRLSIEEMIIGDDFSKINDIDYNQTSALKDKYSKEFNDDFNKLLDRVLISTSDYIHVNSFMYEPLIDIDAKYLQKLFEDIQNYDKGKIWK